MSLRRGVKGAAAALALALLLWGGGFAWFLSRIPDRVADADTVTDAIVVLTGGSLRLESGLALLRAGKAKVLFVTGVHQGVAVADLMRQVPEPADRVACCVELGHAAESTVGNALETAAFMRARHFHSLRLVTASYHMPRSLLDFSRAMPDIEIVPNPVFPEAARDWWRPQGAAILAEEYVKYLVACGRALIPAAS